jgi:cation transport ATPase
MNQETVTVMNWFSLFLLIPATVILAWKLVTEKLRKKRISSDITTMVLLLLSAFIGVAELNIDSGSRLAWSLLFVQLVVLVFLCKRLWSPLMQRLRN